jgi:hypothetical protein
MSQHLLARPNRELPRTPLEAGARSGCGQRRSTGWLQRLGVSWGGITYAITSAAYQHQAMTLLPSFLAPVVQLSRILAKPDGDEKEARVIFATDLPRPRHLVIPPGAAHLILLPQKKKERRRKKRKEKNDIFQLC